MHILIKNKYLILKDYRIKCAVGKRGIGKKTKEGDYITPVGSFKIKLILYRKDKIKKLHTSLKKKAIKENMGWCNDPASNKYNELVVLPNKFSHEKLYRKDNLYDIIMVLNYNMNPVKKNKGSAIFVHVAKRKFKSTEGCIAIQKSELLKIVKNVRLNTKIKIV